jgi:hypothetical protein
MAGRSAPERPIPPREVGCPYSEESSQVQWRAPPLSGARAQGRSRTDPAGVLKGAKREIMEISTGREPDRVGRDPKGGSL